MPSTVVHLAIAGLLAAALLAEDFDWRGLLVVCGAVAFIDLDTVVGLWITGAHRALFHTLLLPGIVMAFLVWDTRVRSESALRTRYDDRGVRVAWVSFVAIVFAGIGPDLFFNGANVFYPIHDQFYKLNGEVLLSTKDGFVQTFVDLSPPEPSGGGGASGGGGQSAALGSTQEKQYWTGVDPNPGEAGAETDTVVERTFPVVRSGHQALLVLTSAFVVGTRLVRNRLS